MRTRKKTSGQKKAENVFFDAARERLTRSHYIAPDKFSVRLAPKGSQQGSSVLFQLDTNDEALAIERAAEILQNIKNLGWDWVLANHPREIVVGFAWNQDPAFATYTTLLTRTKRARISPVADQSVAVLLIVSDETLRNTLEAWVDTLPGMRCAFVFENIEKALKKTALWQGKVAFALCDCRFWGTPVRFPEILGELRKYVPAIPMVCVNVSDALFLQMVGAQYGYILRRTLPIDALLPIRGVETTPEVWSDAVRRYNASLWHNDQAGTVYPTESGNPKELTLREAEILQGISKGLLNKEIAVRLNISVNTVRNHICHIFQKLGISTRTEAAAWYLNR